LGGNGTDERVLGFRMDFEEYFICRDRDELRQGQTGANLDGWVVRGQFCRGDACNLEGSWVDGRVGRLFYSAPLFPVPHHFYY
jgi:hypothetical protein